MILSISQFLINSQSNDTGRSKALSTGQIVIIQVGGERVLSENRLERKRLSYEKKQEVKGVKQVEKKRAVKLEMTPK